MEANQPAKQAITHPGKAPQQGKNRLARRTAAVTMAMFVAVAATGCMQPKVRVTPIYYPKAPATPHVVHLVSFDSLHEIAPPARDFASLFTGAANPFVDSPAGIAFTSGRLYVCDTGANIVHVWPLDGEPPQRIGDRNDLRLSKPVDVAVADDGAIFVADTGLGQVVRITSDGASNAMTPGEDDGFRPVAVATRGDTLYVADIATHKVRVFSADGLQTDALGGVGQEPGEFYFPLGLCVDANNRLYVADAFNSRVQVFDGQHAPLTSMGQPGDRYGDMARPRKVAVGPDGVIFVADPEFAHVHLFDSQGRLLMLLGGPDDTPGNTLNPVGVAIATTLPESITSLVPDNFDAHYYLFVANTVGEYSLSLYAIGLGR